jgi:hypothetical protein
MPAGNIWASDGSDGVAVFGNIQCITAAKPSEDIANPAIIPFMLCPEPNRKRSLNADAKHNLDLCRIKPNNPPTTQRAAVLLSILEIVNPKAIKPAIKTSPSLLWNEIGINALNLITYLHKLL